MPIVTFIIHKDVVLNGLLAFHDQSDRLDISYGRTYHLLQLISPLYHS